MLQRPCAINGGVVVRIVDFFDTFCGHSLSYDDLIFLPGYVDFPIGEVDLSTRLTRSITLNAPIVSSPMDTVTEAGLATAIALQGGIGIIHYNLSPEEQQQQVRRVKRFKNGFVTDPIALPPTSTVRDVAEIRERYGYSTVPITDDGTSHGRLLGIVSKTDYSACYEEYLDKSVLERMVHVENLTIATIDDVSRDGVLDLRLANERLLDSHSAALPIVDEQDKLCYLVTRSDLEKNKNFPHAATDASNCLLVGAAVETVAEKAEERLALLEKYVDVVVFDTSQGYTHYEMDLIRHVKRSYPHLQVIGGNVVTADACEALIAAGADGIRIGMGSGSICTTQEVGGIGRGQATAVYECGKVCREAGVPLVADGGVRSSSDIIKALCLGANSVMLGSLLASTTEAPGRSQIKNGVMLKEYRGMGSLKAMAHGSAVRYGTESSVLRVPEGVSGMVPSRGSVHDWVPCLMQGVRQGIHKMGHRSLRDLEDKRQANLLELERRSESAKREGGVHSLYEVGAETLQSVRGQGTAALAGA